MMNKHLALDNYILTALWSSNDTYNGQDVSLDNCELALSESAINKMNEDITSFFELISENEELNNHDEVLNGNVAHDFWLTRKRHGAGFWDGDYPETGDTLTQLAHSFGGCDLYILDNNTIEVFGS
jgi:hypothetical protein